MYQIFLNSNKGIIHLMLPKMFQKPKISYSLIHIRACACQWLKILVFSGTFAYVLCGHNMDYLISLMDLNSTC